MATKFINNGKLDLKLEKTLTSVASKLKYPSQNFIQEFDLDRSVCMAMHIHICYSGPICTICWEILPMPWTMGHAKFNKDISSKKKRFLKVDRQSTQLHVRYCSRLNSYLSRIDPDIP